MPPTAAIATAMPASVTVSMGEETSGVRSLMLRVTKVERSTCGGGGIGVGWWGLGGVGAGQGRQGWDRRRQARRGVRCRRPWCGWERQSYAGTRPTPRGHTLLLLPPAPGARTWCAPKLMCPGRKMTSS